MTNKEEFENAQGRKVLQTYTNQRRLNKKTDLIPNNDPGKINRQKTKEKRTLQK